MLEAMKKDKEMSRHEEFMMRLDVMEQEMDFLSKELDGMMPK